MWGGGAGVIGKMKDKGICGLLSYRLSAPEPRAWEKVTWLMLRPVNSKWSVKINQNDVGLWRWQHCWADPTCKLLSWQNIVDRSDDQDMASAPRRQYTQGGEEIWVKAHGLKGSFCLAREEGSNTNLNWAFQMGIICGGGRESIPGKGHSISKIRTQEKAGTTQEQWHCLWCYGESGEKALM